jgi:hypothetical protein
MFDNDNNRCLLCSNETQDNEAFCRDCREIAQNSYHEDLLLDDKPASLSVVGESVNDDESGCAPEKETTGYAEAGSFQPGKNKQDTFYMRNKKSLIFLLVCLVLFIVTGMAGGYIRKQNMNAEATELAYWNKCIEENSPPGYSKYLVRFPEGKFSREAHRKIVELRSDEQKSWERLRNTNDVDALFAFITDHPGTPYAREVCHAIDSLSWLAARKQNTADEYLAYIGNVKIGRLNGEYIDIALKRYDYLSQLETLEGKELDEVKNMMASFFEAMSSNNSEEIQKLSADTLRVFYKSANFPGKYITDSLKTGYKAEKIRSVLYTPVTDSIEAILDNEGICFITLPVKREITYMDKKKKKDHTRSVLNIELDNKRLKTIYAEGGTVRP